MTENELRQNASFRRTLLIVVLLNLAYFAVEFTFAWKGSSVSLFADSMDFLEDASINLLIFIGIGWSAANRARLGKLLATLILVPGLSIIGAATLKFFSGTLPDPVALSVVGSGAFLVNALCASLLLHHRHQGGSLTKAAFLSARNDLAANLAIIGAGFLTARFSSLWPDLLVGLAIAALNADAAKEVWEAATEEGAKLNTLAS